MLAIPTNGWEPGTRAIDVAAKTPGAYGANSLAAADFSNPTGVIFDSSSFLTSGSARYMRADSQNSYVVKSLQQAYDMEVTSWVRHGYVFLRLTPDNRAFFLLINGDSNVWTVGIRTGLTEAAFPSGTEYRIATGTLTSIPGYSATDTAGDTFTFGVAGTELYAEFNGVEFGRWWGYWHHPFKGVAAVKAATGYGFRDLTYAVLPTLAVDGNPERFHVNLASYRMRQLATATGSMSAGSPTLTLASNPGFIVGDTVIVEIGGEAGGGLRGTKGVGGTYPAQSYANIGSFPGTAPTNQLAWAEDTGNIYQWSGTQWNGNLLGGFYYVAKAVPRALIAKITAINGLNLTLNASAAVATTNATVHLDCSDSFDKITRRGVRQGEVNYPLDADASTHYNWAALDPPAGVHVIVPPGDYAVGKKLLVYERPNWVIRGKHRDSSRMYSPKGCATGQLAVHTSASAKVQKLHLEGNYGLDGFGFDWSVVGPTTTGPVNETTLPQGRTYGEGIMCENHNNFEISDCRNTDSPQKGFGLENTTGSSILRCEAIFTSQMEGYLQWQIQLAVTADCLVEDCQIISAKIIAGFEPFASDGITFRRCTTVNAVFSCNGSDNVVFEDCIARLTPNSRVTALSLNVPVYNCNNNTGGVMNNSVSFLNCGVELEGYYDASIRLPVGLGASGGTVGAGFELIIDGFRYEGVDGFVANWHPSDSGGRGPAAIDSTYVTHVTNSYVDGYVNEGFLGGAANLTLYNGSSTAVRVPAPNGNDCESCWIAGAFQWDDPNP